MLAEKVQQPPDVVQTPDPHYPQVTLREQYDPTDFPTFDQACLGCYMSDAHPSGAGADWRAGTDVRHSSSALSATLWSASSPELHPPIAALTMLKAEDSKPQMAQLLSEPVDEVRTPESWLHQELDRPQSRLYALDYDATAEKAEKDEWTQVTPKGFGVERKTQIGQSNEDRKLFDVDQVPSPAPVLSPHAALKSRGMGNQCCCDEDPLNKPVDANVLVWRPDQPLRRPEPTAADLLKRDEQLDAALDRIARHQPDDPSPRQSMPKAAEVAEFRRSSQYSQRSEICFQEARHQQQLLQPPSKIGEDVDSNEGLRPPSEVSMPGGHVPQHEVQWLVKYDGDADPAAKAPARPQRSPEQSPVSAAIPVASSNSSPPHAPPLETSREAPQQTSREAPWEAAQVSEGPQPEPVPEVVADPQEEEADEEVPLLPICFQKEDESFEDVFFFAFPIGFDLSKQKPLTVKGVKPESYAEQLGVQVGWKIISIGGVDVSDMGATELLVVLAEQKKKHLG
ncbi:unnamed protein product [Durusdinium trenchii]|uniref:PDZ domain-containing protein n=1 Tax=Durusdinium trenchii TaxID=1381693 RepID=A0ABP0SDC7_9DINO